MVFIEASLNEPHASKSLQNVRSTVSRKLINHSIFGHTYVQQCHGICDTSQSIVNSSILVHSTVSWILEITQSSVNHPLVTTAEGTCTCVHRQIETNGQH